MRLIPRDERFFEMFGQIARRMTESAQLLSQLFAEPAKLDQYCAAIKELEHQADNLTHEVNSKIDTSFITPLDREDIHLLASRLDNVVDLIDGTARRAVMFNLRQESREPARRLAEVLLRSTECIASAVTNMKKPRAVSERSSEIKRLEEEGDAIYHEAVGQLFSGKLDPLEVMKWKEIYDKLEDAVDECEDVANVLESIAIKNS